MALDPIGTLKSLVGRDTVDGDTVDDTVDESTGTMSQMARKQIMARINSLKAERSGGDNFSAFAAGLLQPTKTGSFGESLGYGLAELNKSEAASKTARSAREDLMLKYQLALADDEATANKGSTVKLLPTKVVANNETYSEAWNQIVPEGSVATNVGIMTTEQYRALTASGGRLPSALTATPSAAPTPTPAPTTGAPLAAPGAPLAPTGATTSSERPAVSLPENAKPGLPPGAYKGTDGKMYVNTRFGPKEVMGAAIDVTDLTRAQALAQGYFRGQREPTGKYIFPEAERAPTPEELFRLNSGIAANIGKKTIVMGTLDKAMGDVTNMTASFGGLLLKDLPGPTRDQANRIRTIQANIGFDQLQAMRDASKTGGALGQVAVQELNMLQASLGSLEQAQGVDELAYNLAQVRDHYQKAVEALKGSQYENEALRREILAAQGRPYTPKPKTPAKPAAAVDLNSFYNKP